MALRCQGYDPGHDADNSSKVPKKAYHACFPGVWNRPEVTSRFTDDPRWLMLHFAESCLAACAGMGNSGNSRWHQLEIGRTVGRIDLTMLDDTPLEVKYGNFSRVCPLALAATTPSFVFAIGGLREMGR